MRTASLFVFLAVLSAAPALAQTPRPDLEIFGRVVMPSGSFSNQGGIEVRLERAGRLVVSTATTDSDGRFYFRTLEQGTFYIYINLEGYAPVYEQVSVRLPSRSGPIRDTAQPGITIHMRAGPTNPVEAATRRDGGVPNETIPPAEVVSAELIRKHSEESVRDYMSGLEEVRKGNPDKAIDKFEKAIDAAPDFFEAHVELGSLLHKKGKLPDAEQAFQKAIELSPERTGAAAGLAGIYLDRARMLDQDGKADDAASVYKGTVDLLSPAALKPEAGADVFYFLGSALFKLNELERAESTLLQAVGHAAPAQEARLMLVNVYVRQRRYADAAAQLTAYLEAVPDSPQRSGIEQMLRQIKSALGPIK